MKKKASIILWILLIISSGIVVITVIKMKNLSNSSRYISEVNVRETKVLDLIDSLYNGVFDEYSFYSKDDRGAKVTDFVEEVSDEVGVGTISVVDGIPEVEIEGDYSEIIQKYFDKASKLKPSYKFGNTSIVEVEIVGDSENGYVTLSLENGYYLKLKIKDGKYEIRYY